MKLVYARILSYDEMVDREIITAKAKRPISWTRSGSMDNLFGRYAIIHESGVTKSYGPSWYLETNQYETVDKITCLKQIKIQKLKDLLV
jgi:hypothetical protein